jgi:hypothetical protein
MKEDKFILSTQQPYEILTSFKDVFTEFGFPFQEDADENFLSIYAGIHYPDHGNLKVILRVAIDLYCEAVQISFEYLHPIPEEKMPQVNQLMGILNCWSITGHLYTYTSENQLCYLSSILIRDSGFNRGEFEKVLQVVLGNGPEFFSLIKRVVDKKEDPDALLGKLFEKMFGSRLRSRKEKR